jgi:hypothetical protein
VKVFLLHRDRDFEPHGPLDDEVFEAMASGDLFALTVVKRDIARGQQSQPAQPPRDAVSQLVQDLELETLFLAMADGDDFLFEMARRGVLTSLTDPEEIIFRQQVLSDCLEHPDVVRQIYQLAVEALQNERTVGSLWSGAGPDRILYRSVQVLKLHVDVIKRLRQLADKEAAGFRSEGFRRFFAMLAEELADDYVESVEQHLTQLQFKRGLLESAELGKGYKGRSYTVRTPREQRWIERLSLANRSQSYSFTIPSRDESGFRALDDIRGRGINLVADAVARSADHIKSFFSMLRLELAFYLGCLNLHERLSEKPQPTCLPTPLPAGDPSVVADGLYDVSLTFHLDGPPVGNDLDAAGKALVIITGANQGGKSTLLRSVGIAQLMMQSGMFVGARSFQADVCAGVFTHYKREEDAAMKSGKLDEELARMSDVAGQIRPNSLLLCNESFASTNEREGSEIARQIVRALLDRSVKVFFVTHMYDLAHSFHAQQRADALFLRAERNTDGSRTFRVLPGEPLPTSYGEDSYRRIFGEPRADGCARAEDGRGDGRPLSRAASGAPKSAHGESRSRTPG